jgi:transcriptional regulator
MNNNLITAEQIVKITALYKEGFSQRAIANAIGRSRAGVWGVLSREGLLKPVAKKAKKPVKSSKKRA